MERQFDRIDNKLDQLGSKIEDINVTLAVNTKSLQEHMRRTEIAEAHLIELENRIMPITLHVERVRGVFWFISAIAGAVTVIAAVVELIKRVI